MCSFSIFFFPSKRKEKKPIEKKKNVEKGGSLPSSSCSAFSLLPSHFCPPIFALMFHVLSLSIFFSSRRKEKKHKEKKTIEKKKNQRREGAYLQAPILPSHVWLLLLPSYFCPFVSNVFS